MEKQLQDYTLREIKAVLKEYGKRGVPLSGIVWSASLAPYLDVKLTDLEAGFSVQADVVPNWDELILACSASAVKAVEIRGQQIRVVAHKTEKIIKGLIVGEVAADEPATKDVEPTPF